MKPPRLARWLFEWYCGNASVSDLQGDVEEIYYRNLKKFGRRKANVIYWRQVLSLIFSYALRKRKKNASHHHLSSPNPFDMLGNYFKVGIRNLLRHRYFTILNMAGLAIGMSISLLFITLFISVTDYDEFHTQKRNIYRVITKTNNGDEMASAPAALAEKLKSEYPGIKAVVPIFRGLYSEEPLPKQNLPMFGFYTDPSFLTTFTFPLVAGDAKTALNHRRSIVLTETLAKKIFGTSDPMGRQVSLNAGMYQVTGIMKDFPANTHLSFQALAPYASIDQALGSVEQQWSKFNDHYVYLLLEDGQDPSKLQDYLDRVAAEVYSTNPDFKAEFTLQALGDITPGPELNDNIGPEWSYLSFGISGGLALLILLPACFNYTNISIARALKRSKEIGLRKTLGGMRRQIFTQFIAETVIVTVVSLIGACAIFFVIRSEFQSILVHASALDLSLTAERVFYFLLFAMFTGFVAGFVPAMHFSRLNPIDAIKNNVPKAFSGMRIRKGLIVFQFALCLTFILGLVIFNKQYRYAMNFDLGFDEDNIVDVDLYQVDPQVVSNEFSKLPFVQKVSMSSGIMGHGVPMTWAALDGKKDSAEVFYMHVDGNFIGNMGVELLAGRTFGTSAAGETSVIINETMMKRFSFAGPSEAVGQQVRVDGLSLEIIGVIKDFHFWQLHRPPGNFFFRSNPEKFRYANVRVVSSDVQTSLEEMERTWTSFSKGALFTGKFLSDATAAAFDSYRTMIKILGFLALLAVSVACLGMLGMVVYTAESKTKEVGIRKVMGASRWSLAYLLSKDFLKLMLIASLFAIPVAMLLNKALSGLDHYRVAITFLDIALGLFGMFALGLATMAWQTWKTASINPAETLKYE